MPADVPNEPGADKETVRPDKLRSSMNVTEYKHIDLRLIFHVFDTFDERRAQFSAAFSDGSNDLYLRG